MTATAQNNLGFFLKSRKKDDREALSLYQQALATRREVGSSSSSSSSSSSNKIAELPPMNLKWTIPSLLPSLPLSSSLLLTRCWVMPILIRL